MNFRSILEEINKQILSEKDNVKKQNALSYLEEQLKNNPIFRYQFKMLNSLKEGKRKIKTTYGIDNFIRKINKKHSDFITEYSISHLDIWRENKKLLEYFNINPNSLSISLIDKALDINNHNKLNEIAIRRFLGKKENVDKSLSKKVMIRESFHNIIEENNKKNALKNIKIVKFLGECTNKKDKTFILNSLTKIKTMITSSNLSTQKFNEAINKLYKLRLLTEKRLRLKESSDDDIDDEESEYDRLTKTSPGKRVKLQDLKHIKKIEVETPRNYKNPEKIIISLIVPFCPAGAYYSEVTEKLKEIKKKFDRLERIFINKEIYQANRKELFNPVGTIWDSLLRIEGIKVGETINYSLSIYLNTNPSSIATWEDYYNTCYEMLKDFDKYLEDIFPVEMDKEYQLNSLKDKQGTRRKYKDAKEEETYDHNLIDDFSGIF